MEISARKVVGSYSIREDNILNNNNNNDDSGNRETHSVTLIKDNQLSNDDNNNTVVVPNELRDLLFKLRKVDSIRAIKPIPDEPPNKKWTYVSSSLSIPLLYEISLR